MQDEQLIGFFHGQPSLEGQVEGVRCVRDRATNVGKGFAFVLFRSREAARAAASLDGQLLNKRPLRITRGRDWQSLNVKGLYPAGEGAGYAGGIMSAGVDGIEAAEAVGRSVLGL